ncbi:hypothetical protein GCM10023063_37200 [Arthrobacter methylotrophus]|uniref:hypothetical protein n=1 Tax=Arthrobacter methylotrophus TaxID=121291 RepID=UPI0031E9043B
MAGTPDPIADRLADWQAAGADGINVINWRLPGSYQEFNEQLLPTLQRRAGWPRRNMRKARCATSSSGRTGSMNATRPRATAAPSAASPSTTPTIERLKDPEATAAGLLRLNGTGSNALVMPESMGLPLMKCVIT